MAKEEFDTEEDELEGEAFFTKKKIIILAAAILLLAGVGAAVYFFVLNKPDSDSEEPAQTMQSSQSTTADSEAVEESNVFEFDSFIVNILNDGVTHYLKMEIAFDTRDPKTKEKLSKEVCRIKDAIILLSSSKTFDEVCDLNGKLQLKQDIKELVNGILGKEGHVNKVYFTDFVIQ